MQNDVSISPNSDKDKKAIKVASDCEPSWFQLSLIIIIIIIITIIIIIINIYIAQIPCEYVQNAGYKQI